MEERGIEFCGGVKSDLARWPANAFVETGLIINRGAQPTNFGNGFETTTCSRTRYADPSKMGATYRV